MHFNLFANLCTLVKYVQVIHRSDRPTKATEFHAAIMYVDIVKMPQQTPNSASVDINVIWKNAVFS